MRIAYIGLKGLPGTFSGIETHIHELGTRLIARGHEVTAYVRPQYTPRHTKDDAGIRLRHMPTIPTKHLDAAIHSCLATLDAIGKKYDVVHFHTIGPGSFAPLLRWSSPRLVTTIHRFDYLSGKWGWFASSCLRMAERISLCVPDRTIVVAPFMRSHYQARGHQVDYIPNGVTLPRRNIGSEQLRELDLVPNQYILFLGRLVPEKRPDWAVQASLEGRLGSMKLVIAGGSSATDHYVRHLQTLSQPLSAQILLPGAVYGSLKDELFANARAFILPSALEGLPITLLEAMSYQKPCLVSNIPPHADVIEDGVNGFLHHADDINDFGKCLQDIVNMSEEKLLQIGADAHKTVTERYDWNDIVDQIETLYHEVLHPDSVPSAPIRPC